MGLVQEIRELREHLTEHPRLYTLAENLDRCCVMLTGDGAAHQLLDFVFAKEARTKRGFDKRPDVNLVIGPHDGRDAR